MDLSRRDFRLFFFCACLAWCWFLCSCGCRCFALRLISTNAVLDFRSHALSGDANSTNLQNAEYVSSPVREMSSLTMSVTKQSQPGVRYLYLRLDDGSVVKALRAELETHSQFFRNLSSTTETVIVSSTSRRVLEKFVQFLDGHVVSVRCRDGWKKRRPIPDWVRVDRGDASDEICGNSCLYFFWLRCVCVSLMLCCSLFVGFVSSHVHP